MIYTAARAWRRPELPGLLVPLSVVALVLLLVALTQIGLAFVAAGLAVLVVAAVVALRHPFGAAVFMVAYASVNRFVVMLVYHYTGSVSLTKAVELWKEGVLAVLVVRVLYDLLFTPDRTHVVKVMDIAVLLFIGVSAVYLLYPGPLHVDLFTRLQGFRTDTVFMFAYWAGRGLRLRRREVRRLMFAFVPGTLVVAAVAMWQVADYSGANLVFNNLGFQDFNFLQTGTLGPGAIRARDLPGAAILPRASSLQLSDLALAFYQLLAVSMAAALFVVSRRTVHRVVTGLFLGAMFVTLVVTATRSAIGSAVGTAAVTALATARLFQFAVFALLLTAASLVLLQFGPVSAESALALTNFDDPSSQQHQALLAQSIEAIQQDPMGRGLGTVGLVAQTQLKGGQALTNESWYLQLGVEMGIVGMAAYVAVLAGVFAVSVWSFWRVEDTWLRAVTLTVAAGAAAFLIAGNFLHAWENTPVAMVFWLFAGIAARARDLDRSPDYGEAA